MRLVPLHFVVPLEIHTFVPFVQLFTYRNLLFCTTPRRHAHAMLCHATIWFFILPPFLEGIVTVVVLVVQKRQTAAAAMLEAPCVKKKHVSIGRLNHQH